MSDIVDECRRESLALLRAGAGPHGFSAAVGDEHYGGIWARDALICCWAALDSDDAGLVTTVETTLRTLATHQAPFGQIPAVVWPDRGWWDWGDAGATDAAALFALTCCAHHQVTGDDDVWAALQPSCDQALTWLAAQDAANWGLVDSPEAADWMDSTLNRGGKVLSINSIYARALELRHDRPPTPTALLPTGRETAARINLLLWPQAGRDLRALLAHVARAEDAAPPPPHPVMDAAYRDAARADRRHYCSHVTYGRFTDALDVLGNALAVTMGVAGRERAQRVLAAFDAAEVEQPFPARAWGQPATAERDPWQLWSRAAERFQDERWRNPPHRYHNAGVWPYIGGFVVAARALVGDHDGSQASLRALARANALDGWSFPEWIDAATAEPAGTRHQLWNAGAYLLADATCAGRVPAPLVGRT